MHPEVDRLNPDLQDRLRFETMLSDLSSRFVNLEPAEVDREIEEAQRRVCECLELDLSALWQLSPEEPGVLRMTHLYWPPVGPPPGDDGAALSMDEVQRRHILKALEAAGGRIRGSGGAAELLGLKPTTLRSRMQRLGLDPRRLRDERSSSSRYIVPRTGVTAGSLPEADGVHFNADNRYGAIWASATRWHALCGLFTWSWDSQSESQRVIEMGKGVLFSAGRRPAAGKRNVAYPDRGRRAPGRLDTPKEETMLSSISRFARGKPRVRTVAGLGVLAVVMAFALGSAPGIAAAGEVPVTGKWGGPIDPDALQILKGMTDYLGSLQRFSMHTENTYEDVLETGQKIQFGFSTNIVVQRPDKIRAERTEGTAHQLFIYDGAKLFTYESKQEFFATVDVPDNIDDFLHFARDSLDLVPPAGDMVFSNAFELLMAGVTSGFLVGEAEIGGVSCYHLAFTTPVVDWQVWIADGDTPLPYKYVLTTTDDPAQPQFVTLISNWNTDPKIGDKTFEFKPPATAMEIDFIRVKASTTSAR